MVSKFFLPEENLSRLRVRCLGCIFVDLVMSYKHLKLKNKFKKLVSFVLKDILISSNG